MDRYSAIRAVDRLSMMIGHYFGHPRRTVRCGTFRPSCNGDHLRLCCEWSVRGAQLAETHNCGLAAFLSISWPKEPPAGIR